MQVIHGPSNRTSDVHLMSQADYGHIIARQTSGPFPGCLGCAPFSGTFQSGSVLMGTMDSEKASATNALQPVKVVEHGAPSGKAHYHVGGEAKDLGCRVRSA